MARTIDILAGLGIGIFVGVGASFALSPAPAVANAGYAPGTETFISNKAAKGDLVVAATPVRVDRNLLPAPVTVRQVQVLGDGDASILLLDEQGRVVYRSPASQRGSAAAPKADSLSMNRIDNAFRATGRNS
ncbi:hypothetical protein [Terrihabitans rhizophilus]|uniref:Uncharacterized protein n=1 Tax=Terrihabitans rhizophilus TaxID=3092662 RepID=A0ABU4RQQ0_9HYPH|nr:hypothetical protein [Terrihabitans sp. PJ23]MDX6806503.1 hypothetical protein [Terrihabitans sp. PJ23]